MLSGHSTHPDDGRSTGFGAQGDIYLELVGDVNIGSTLLTLPFTTIGPRALELKIREPSPSGQVLQTVVKRSLDVVIASIMLVVLAPLMVAVAIWIKLDSPGPVFFGHRRVGKHGRPITVWKFRSMRCDISEAELVESMHADAEVIHDSPVYKSRHDPRVTAVGKRIRRTGIDELPQLFNVLFGTMSLVGPRPLVDEEVAELSPIHHAYRNSVPPGITGLWQVFRSEETSFDERIRLDLLYVGCRSVWLDAYILATTPLALLKGDRSF